MAEYIDREALLKEAESRIMWGASAVAVYESIEDAPTADVAPVRHGRWVTTSGEVFPGSSQFLCYSHKHEECGFQYVDMNENEYDYCPNCGAKMYGEWGEQ